MNSQVTCSTNYDSTFSQTTLQLCSYSVTRLKNILKVMLANENHCCPILTVHYGNWVSVISVKSPLYHHCLIWTPLWQAVKVVLDLDVPNFIKSLPLQWTHLWFWQLTLLLPFPYYGVFTLVCVQSNYRINSASGGHLIKVSKWERADPKKGLDLSLSCMSLNRCLKLRKLTLHTNCLFTLPEGIHFLTNLEVRAVIMW